MALVANKAIKASAISAAMSTPFRLPIRLVFLSNNGQPGASKYASKVICCSFATYARKEARPA